MRDTSTIPIYLRFEWEERGAFYGIYPNTDASLDAEIKRLKAWGLDGSQLPDDYELSGHYVFPNDGAGIHFEITIHDPEA